MRLKLAGFQSVSLFESKGYHKSKERTTERALGTVFNRLYIISTIYHLRTIVVVFPALCLFEVYLIIFLIKQNQFGVLFRAYYRFLSNLRNIRKKRIANQLLRKRNDRELLSEGKIYVPHRILEGNIIISHLFKAMNKCLNCYWEVIVFAGLI